MSRKTDLPTSRRHVLIYDEDWSFLENHYGNYSTNRIGAGIAARQIIHRAVLLLKQKAADEADRRLQRIQQTELSVEETV